MISRKPYKPRAGLPWSEVLLEVNLHSAKLSLDEAIRERKKAERREDRAALRFADALEKRNTSQRHRQE